MSDAVCVCARVCVRERERERERESAKVYIFFHSNLQVHSKLLDRTKLLLQLLQLFFSGDKC